MASGNGCAYCIHCPWRRACAPCWRMVRRQLDERQWGKIEAVLVAGRGAGRPPKDNRNFIEAVLWWRRTGVPWRDLPDDFGPWKTVFNRFDRWSKAGKWTQLFQALQTDRDDEWHSIDSTINRAPSTPRAERGGRRAGHRSLSRRPLHEGPRGGRRARTPAHVRDHRRPTARQSTRQGARRPRAVDVSARRQGVRFGCLSSRARRAELRARHSVERQPGEKLPYDKERYKARSEIECTFSLLKQARRFATRYEKTLRNYAAVVAIGCALSWLRI